MEKEEVIFQQKTDHNGVNEFKLSLSSITVEPLVLIYILPSTINTLITQNLILEESCRVNLGYNQSVCDAIMQKNTSGYTEIEETSVQKLASDILFIKSLVHGVIPVIIMLFVGSWSDGEHRRRPCILGPIIGELIAVAFLIANSLFSHKLPALLTALAYSLPMAISGGLPCLFLGVYSYVATCSSEESLTMKIGGVSTIEKLAYIVGFGISGIILNLLGFIGSYTTTFFMILSSFVYGYYILRERRIIVTDMEEEFRDLKEAPIKFTEDLYVMKHFFHTIRVLLSKRPCNRRLRLFACVLLIMIVNGPLKGEQSVFFLYTKFRFGWNYWHYCLFYAGQFVFEIIGSLLVLLILIKYFKWKDEALGILSFTSSIIACIVFAIAGDGIWFSAGAILNLFNGTSQIALRSLMSKLVQNHEIGKTNSIFQISESLTHLFFGSVYTLLYKNSMHVFAGSIFLLSSVLKFVGVIIFIWLFDQSVKHKTGNVELELTPQSLDGDS
ncbi:uncharacterized protein LOC123322897 isoform X1 [Coccinella septempunctata]|uniref:uncharacterized protein LOC123322897 isoform X1 n=1 Tax=Coccinella septempunctata TaxID=41139 RepID=UPI001D06F020|nr:uncharacterized protein LOC123322897 isoform X1 [Coccinella septempunctata]